MTATATTPGALMTPHQRAATEIGYDRGYTHAAFSDAYGGDPHAEPDVPTRFADVHSYYAAAYDDGVNDYFDETQEP